MKGGLHFPKMQTSAESDRSLPQIGEGVYTFREAAAILRGFGKDITVRQLRYWMADIVPASHQAPDDEPILTFDDLISLEVIRRFRSIGTSLQRIRRVEEVLRRSFPALHRPFAYKRFFTDGANVWAEEVGSDGRLLIEIHGKRRNHYAWIEAIRTFAEDVRFDEDLHANGWRLSPWVEVDPQIQFGAPVIVGTRVPLRTIEVNLEVGSPEEVANWYGLTVDQVEGARDYLKVR